MILLLLLKLRFSGKLLLAAIDVLLDKSHLLLIVFAIQHEVI